MVVATMGKRAKKNSLRPHDQAPAPVAFVPPDPIPPGVTAACETANTPVARRDGSITSQRARSTAMESQSAISRSGSRTWNISTVAAAIIEEGGREVLDVWPVPSDLFVINGHLATTSVTKVWLCPGCYDVAITFAHADRLGEWVSQYRWDASVAEEVDEQIRLASRCHWSDSIDAAVRMYRVDADGNRVGVKLVEGDLDQIEG